MSVGVLLLFAVYVISPFAGSDFGGDGRPASETQLVQPQGVAVDKDGSIVFADAGEHRVRRILPNGFVSQIAGDGLKTPYGVAIGPDGDVYVADLGNARVLRIRKDGTRQEIGGFQQPRNVAVDANGTLYVSDFGANAVYRVRADGTLESALAEKVKAPAGLAFAPSGALYVADSGNQRVLAVKAGIVQTVLKDFGAVTSIAVDRGGRLYAAGGDRVAVVGPSGDITLLNTEAQEVALDVYGLLVTAARRQIRSYRNGVTTILAGNPLGSFVGDGRPREEWRFLRPTGIARNSEGHLYIADSDNGGIRRVDAEARLSTRVASLDNPAYVAADGTGRIYFSDTKAGVVYRINLDGKSEVYSKGTGVKPFLRPTGLAYDRRGQLFVADTGNGLIRKIFDDGFVTTVAGGGTSDKDGFGTSIAINNPVGVAVAPDGAVWFTEAGRLRVLKADGKVTTLTEVPVIDPRGIRFDGEGRLLVADAGTHRILRVKTETGEWEILAGTGKQGFAGDNGPAAEALLNTPTDVLPEADGSILICDSGNNRIRQIKVAEAGPIVPPAEIVEGETLSLAGVVENADGTTNSGENPASRTGTLKLELTGGEPLTNPQVVAEIASLDVPVVSAIRSGNRLVLILQLNGGFLPSGTVPLVLTVDGLQVPGPVNVSIR